jgi:WD40 repeat protein
MEHQIGSRQASAPVSDSAGVDFRTQSRIGSMEMLKTHAAGQDLAVERVELDEEVDDGFQYDAVSVSDSDGEGAFDDLDLDRALLAVKQADAAANAAASGGSRAAHGRAESKRDNEAGGPGGDTVYTEEQHTVVEDYLRNFLIKAGMLRTLDSFNTEWYEKAQQGTLPGHSQGDTVPDVYATTADLEDRMKRLQVELRQAQDVAGKAQGTWDQFRKERDFHRMHHKRVVQEKNKLIVDLKRLKKHYEAYEPTIAELKDKYEAAMKEKMLMRLERDRTKAKTKALEAQLAALQTPAEDTKTKTKKKRKKGSDTPFPTEDVANPHLETEYLPAEIASFNMAHTFKGHEAGVSAVAWHPTKPIVATASDDACWRMWSIPDGELIMSGEGHQDWLAAVAFHPQGTHLASSSGDGVVKVWDFVTASCAATYADHTGAAWGVDWHYTGDFLASCSMDHTVKLWDAHSNRCRQTMRGHADSVNALAFQPFSCNLATASGDKTVSIWDVRSGLCVQTFYGHSNAVNDCVFSLRGATIVSCDADGIVKLWDVRVVAELATLEAGTQAANKVALDASGSILSVASDDGSMKVFDTASMAALGSLRGHEDAVQACAFSSDSTYMVSGGSDHTFRVWCNPQHADAPPGGAAAAAQ